MKLKKLYIIASILLIAGLILFATGFSMLDFDITKLSTEKEYEARSYVSSGLVREIFIDDRIADIEIASSIDDKIHISYYENDKEYYDISETAEGKLIIQNEHSRKWYDYFFTIQLGKPIMKLEVPDSYNCDIKIDAHDGYVSVTDVSVGNLEISTIDDAINVQNVSASGKIEVNTVDEDIIIKNTTAIEDIDCKTTSGKIDLDSIQANNINVKNTDGKIAFKSVISNRNINVKAVSSDVQLNTVDFGEELTCSVTDGDVRGDLTGSLADYSVTTKVVDGKSNLPESMKSGDKIINIKITSGNIQLDFLG